MSERAPAGWYDDQSGGQRYWDGDQWTDQHRGAGAEQGAKNSKRNWIVLGIVGAVVVLCGIGSIGVAISGGGTDTATETGEPAAVDDDAPETKFDGKAYAAKVEKAFTDQLGSREIKDMCDDAYTHWACFYDKVEADSESTIRLYLTTDGGWSDDDLKQLSEEAARHWFNFLQFDHKQVETIVVQANGRDRNHYKRNYPYLD